MTWKCLGESVAGTSHRATGTPCQDANRLAVLDHPGGPVLVAVVADGAGSAARAELGATTACEALRDAARDAVMRRRSLDSFEPADVRAWFLAAREELCRVAGATGVEPRDLACTALLAVVGPGHALFGQVGDGAVVVGTDTTFTPIFWPEPAEYVNVTDFLTDDDLEARLLLDVLAEPFDTVALLTDGLQRLALDYAKRCGHPGFFGPLFAPLRDGDAEALRGPLRALLDSAKINDRTDDDKTLALATRGRDVPAPPRG